MVATVYIYLHISWRHFSYILVIAIPLLSSVPSAAADSPLPSSASLGKRRVELRAYLQRKSGTRPEKPTIPRGKPADHFVCYKQYRDCQGDKRKLYATIAKHLRMSESLLEQEQLEVKRSGLCIVWVAMHCALTDLEDSLLATEICDVWLMPSIDCASLHNHEPSSMQNMLTGAVTIYLQSKAYEKVLPVAWRWLKKNEAEGNFNGADAARMQIAAALEGLERFEQAARMLNEIESPELRDAKRRIPELRNKRDEQLKKLEEEFENASSKSLSRDK